MRDWLSHRVVSTPDDTALIRAEDGEAWTYTDLDRLVSETAGRLVAHGIEADDTGSACSRRRRHPSGSSTPRCGSGQHSFR